MHVKMTIKTENKIMTSKDTYFDFYQCWEVLFEKLFQNLTAK